MSDLSRKARNSVALQREMFRIAEHDHGLSVSVLCRANKHLKASTVKGWKNDTAMPAYAIGELRRAGMPAYLLGFVLDPWGLTVGEGSAVEEAYEELALECSAYLHDYHERKADGVLCHRDRQALDDRKRRLTNKAVS